MNPDILRSIPHPASLPLLKGGALNAETPYEDGTYLAKNRTWHAEDSFWKAKQVSRILIKNNLTPSSICEVGCGAGEILTCLADGYGPNVLFSGYEVSPQAFEICKKIERQNIHYFLKDLLQEEQSSFDVVMALDVFEHVEDYIGFLRELRPRGEYKIFHIPLDISAQTVLRSSPISAVRAKYGHIHFFTKEIALAALKHTGYEVVDYFYTPGNLELPNLDLKKKLMRLPRRLFFALHQDLAVRILGGFSLLVLAK
jgi:Methyltransferase domain